jgi:Bacterial Ig-like domain (group 3)
VTALSLSSSTVAYGYEQFEKFSVKVTAGAPGTGVPTGYVVVESGTKILCSIHLHRGTGSCSPAARALARGPYKIVAYYGGDKNFKPSTSSPKTLTVLRH